MEEVEEYIYIIIYKEKFSSQDIQILIISVLF